MKYLSYLCILISFFLLVMLTKVIIKEFPQGRFNLDQASNGIEFLLLLLMVLQYYGGAAAIGYFAPMMIDCKISGLSCELYSLSPDIIIRGLQVAGVIIMLTLAHVGITLVAAIAVVGGGLFVMALIATGIYRFIFGS